jgi:hypothetical protein
MSLRKILIKLCFQIQKWVDLISAKDSGIALNYEPDNYNTEDLEKTDSGENQEVEEKIEDGKRKEMRIKSP